MFGDTRLDKLLDSHKRDYDYMVNWGTHYTTQKKSRKKYRGSNVFVDTYLHYRFPLAFSSREAAVDHA